MYPGLQLAHTHAAHVDKTSSTASPCLRSCRHGRHACVPAAGRGTHLIHQIAHLPAGCTLKHGSQDRAIWWIRWVQLYILKISAFRSTKFSGCTCIECTCTFKNQQVQTVILWLFVNAGILLETSCRELSFCGGSPKITFLAISCPYLICYLKPASRTQGIWRTCKKRGFFTTLLQKFVTPKQVFCNKLTYNTV